MKTLLITLSLVVMFVAIGCDTAPEKRVWDKDSEEETIITGTDPVVPNDCECSAKNDCCDGCYVFNDGGSCGENDDLDCTSNVCDAGECKLDVLDESSCLIEGKCYNAGDLDELESCRVCDASNPKEWTVKGNSEPCALDDLCQLDETCQAGICTAADNQSNYCQGEETCKAESGECNLEECKGCTEDKICYEIGAKRPSNECAHCSAKDMWSNAGTETACTSDGLYCTQDVCSGGECTHPPITSCANGCDEERDKCCIQDFGLGCFGGNVHNYDSCGVVGSRLDTCEATEQCEEDGSSASCVACECSGTSTCCDGCMPWNQDKTCYDGGPCVEVGACNVGICESVAQKDCSGADDQCNVGVCEQGTGNCIAQPANEGGECNDGNAGTIGDVCVSGTCAGTETVCGNDVKEGAEECDGADIGGMDCGDFGYAEGGLSCDIYCTFNYSGCMM